MIAVEIPAALANRPKVVPVDLTRECITCKGRDTWPHRMCRCRDTDTPGRIKVNPDRLVGQRVALAWRETCVAPQCAGRRRWGCPVDGCHLGERMVVGWTAEVAEVAEIVAELRYDGTLVVHSANSESLALCGPLPSFLAGSAPSDGRNLSHLLPLADWSPSRYALVLRDVQTLGDIVDGELVSPMRCRPFHGFAELGEVLVG